MTRAISAAAKGLLANARNLQEAAELIEAGKSTFGEWSIPGLLPRQGTAVIYGPSGTAKTFLSIHLALRLAGGFPWFGSAVRKGTVVYLVTEDRAGVEARAVAAAHQMDGLGLVDLPFEFLTPPHIHSDSWTGDLLAALAEIQRRNEEPIAAVFLDTLGAAFGGRSQDDASQMTVATDAVEAVAERFKCLFVTVHHSGKDQDRGMRGSQVLKDRSDTVITLGKQKGGTIRLNVEKQRNGPLGQPATFRLEPIEIALGNHRINTCIIADLELTDAKPAAEPTHANKTTEPRSTPRPLPRDAQTALDALRSLANGTGTSIDSWRTSVYQAFGDRDDAAKRQAFHGARKRLLENGFIAIEGDTVRILA